MKLLRILSRRCLLLALAAFLAQLATNTHAQPAAKPYVILVSIDGFRFDYAERFKAKNILAVRDNGAAAASMIPSFPSVTFPNHVSIVTGMYPEHHGIVGNSFWDPARNEQYSMQRTGTDGSWYETATPLWVLAEQQHLIAACMFWPTCDGEIRGVRPTYWKKYDGGVPDESRVKQVIQWLKLPAEQRPHFITLYFSDVDSAGHRYGPESLETAEAVTLVDGMIGQLRKDLDALKLPVDLILVSDHGMQDVNDGEVSLAEDADPAVRIVVNGPIAYIYCKNAETLEKTYARMKKSSRFDVYKRADTPPSWHLNENPRSGDLVAVVKGSAVFTLTEPTAKTRITRGEHGYDPRKFPSMGAIFYAIGPNVAPETKIPPFENVNVYPFIAKILGLQLPEQLDGSPAVLAPIYRP